MSDSALLAPAPSGAAEGAAEGTANVGEGTRSLFLRIAWRNLWRRRLRTWMSAGGLAFAIFLVSFFVALQAGVYGNWIDSATRLMTGHLQVQHPDYLENPKPGNAVPSATELVRQLEQLPGARNVAPRAEAFALVSAGERSFGALVMGVDAEREARMFDLPKRLVAGEYLPRADSAYLGASLATNLGVEIGDEIVALGSSEEGGVAVLALTVDGIFETGQAELDRSILQAPLTALQSAFEMGDSTHRIAVETVDSARVDEFAATFANSLPTTAGLRLLTWRELLPEVDQSIELDRISAIMVYWLLMLVVVISVVNAFVMTVFERTREFGMLMAIGMKPNAIVAMLATEAVFVWMFGAIIGLALCIATVLPLRVVGIPLGGFEEFEEMATRMMMPESLYPKLSWQVFTQTPLIMLAGTLIAALIPALRVRRMRPVDALREEE